jgi:predicted alpha/beta hydrolase
MEPRIDETLRIPALDGFELAATLYEPAAGAGDGGPVVLINSATAVRRGYYDGYARHLAAEGFTVLTYDYRGIGGSRPRSLAGFPARMRQWGEQDLAGVLDWIADHLRPKRLLAVGHSVGGQIVGLAGNNHRIQALMMVASQSGWWGHWPVPARYRIALHWFVMIPLITRIYGYLPGRFGTKEDLPGGVAREWARWGRRRTYLLESEDLRAGFERVRRPLLAYSFTDDDYAPRPAVEGLLDFYSEADVFHRHLAPKDVGAESIGHFGFFREQFRDTLWRDSTAWLKKTPSRILLREAGEGASARPELALILG